MPSFPSHKKRSSRAPNSSGGFTLVEVLVSLVIFSIAITGVITVAFIGGTNINSAKNEVTASYLAQEGIELVRADRDTTVIGYPGVPDTGWSTFVSAITSPTMCGGGTGCKVSSLDQSTFLECAPGTGGCGALNVNSAGYYSYQSGGTASPFTRTITVTAPDANSVLVVSQVSWKEGLTQKSVSFHENLFDWYMAP